MEKQGKARKSKETHRKSMGKASEKHWKSKGKHRKNIGKALAKHGKARKSIGKA